MLTYVHSIHNVMRALFRILYHSIVGLIHSIVGLIGAGSNWCSLFTVLVCQQLMVSGSLELLLLLLVLASLWQAGLITVSNALSCVYSLMYFL